jgi:hypothetical protein
LPAAALLIRLAFGNHDDKAMYAPANRAAVDGYKLGSTEATSEPEQE